MTTRRAPRVIRNPKPSALAEQQNDDDNEHQTSFSSPYRYQQENNKVSPQLQV